MRIGLVIYGSLDAVSGGYLYDRKLVEHLRSQGEQVEVVSLPWRSYLRHLGDNFSLTLRQRLARLEVDVLLQDELNHPSLFRVNQQLKAGLAHPRPPVAAIVHHLRVSEAHPRWQLALYRLVERSYLSSVDAFIYNSQTTRRSVADLLGRGRSGTAAERPGMVATPAGDQLSPQISDSEITVRAHQPGPLRLLFVGNLIRRKGLHTLLAALEKLPSGAATLTVVGSPLSEPGYVRRLHRWIAASRLGDRVEFLGALTGTTLAAQFESHHLVVMPSTYEGFGIAYLEGMGFGLPAVATTSGAAGEIITHAQDGFLVPPEDPEALSVHLLILAQDRAKLAAMGQAARRRYLAHPTWEQTGDTIYEFLQGLL